MLTKPNKPAVNKKRDALARLHHPVQQEGIWYTGRYAAEFDGELIVQDSRDPEHDLARILLARGITGKLTLLDGKTGKPRTIIDIEKAAKLTVSEESRDGLRIRKHRENPDTRSYSPEEGRVTLFFQKPGWSRAEAALGPVIDQGLPLCGSKP